MTSCLLTCRTKSSQHWVSLVRNRVVLISDVLPDISLVVDQSTVNSLRALRARKSTISRLTSNQRNVGQQITVSKNILHKKIIKIDVAVTFTCSYCSRRCFCPTVV